MTAKYDWPDEIPDEAIREAFAKADLVKFSRRGRAEPTGRVQYRDISFGDLGWWLPMKRVLPLTGITPEMLKKSYQEIAKFLGKSVEVWMEEKGSGTEQLLLFTVHSSGKIIEVVRN